MSVIATKRIGEPVLRETAEPVKDFTSSSLQSVVDDLIDTMRTNELAGMAAPQIGTSLRVFVSEIRETKYRTGEVDELRVYINPQLVSVSHGTVLDWEGCGSIPGIFGKVERAAEIVLKYKDVQGVSREMSATGLLARVIQHEIDHLNGVLFVDISDPRTFVSTEFYLTQIRGK